MIPFWWWCETTDGVVLLNGKVSESVTFRLSWTWIGTGTATDAGAVDEEEKNGCTCVWTCGCVAGDGCAETCDALEWFCNECWWCARNKKHQNVKPKYFYYSIRNQYIAVRVLNYLT